MTRQEILLTQLAEECSEVIQNVSKTLRFGKDERYHKLEETNAERVTSEMNDLLGVFNMLADEGVLPHIDQDKVKAKKDKVEHYMQYSMGCQKEK